MSEFINEDENYSTENKNSKWMMTAIIILGCIVLFLIFIIFVNNCSDIYGPFLGAFPSRSDPGVDKFNLQKEIDHLLQKQINNLGRG